MALNRYHFLENYLKNIYELSLDLDKECLINISESIIRIHKLHGTVYIVGNGGSASIASHVAVDFLKSLGIKAMTFNESSLITCYANDYGYENWVKEVIKVHCTKGDILISISSSGESLNIVNGIEEAKKKNIFCISLTGFKKNNHVSKISDISFWVDSENYNVVETLHLVALLNLIERFRANKT